MARRGGDAGKEREPATAGRSSAWAIFAAFLLLLLGVAALWLAWAPRVPGGGPGAELGVGGDARRLRALRPGPGGSLAAGLARRWRSGPSVRWAVAALILVTLGLETGAEALVDPMKRSDDLMAAIAAWFPGQDRVPAYLPPVVSNEAIFGIITFKLGRLTRALTTPEDVERLAREPSWRAGPVPDGADLAPPARAARAAPLGLRREGEEGRAVRHRRRSGGIIYA